MTDGLPREGKVQPLSKVEADVLFLLTEEFLTPKQISLRRKKTKQAISQTIKRLRKKGFISLANKRLDQEAHTGQPLRIRLHGEMFHINILWKDDRYKNILGRVNQLMLDGNTVRLHADSVDVYSNRSFFGESATKATAESIPYWQRFFLRLENELKINVLKERYQNISRVKAEYAHVDSDIAKKAEEEGRRIRLFSFDDGKLWFVVDNSFNLHESETVHPKTAQRDMSEVIEPFLQDLRRNPVTFSDVLGLVSRLAVDMRRMAEAQSESAKGLQALAKLVELQLKKEPEVAPQEPESKPDYVG